VEALRKLRSPPSSSSPRPQAPINHVQPRTSQGTFAAAPIPPPAPAPTSFGPAPMDLSANRRKITPQERAARLAEGRCLYCGGHGHMAASCPNKPAHLRAAATNPAPQESGNA
jgi:hypothetical protein